MGEWPDGGDSGGARSDSSRSRGCTGDFLPDQQPRSPGALLPGSWPGHSGASAGPVDREPSPARRLRGARLALAAGGLAVACTVLGGVVGGYIALHSLSQSAVNPGYSLGTVPPALTNRPASSVAGIAARVTPAVVMIKVDGGLGTGSGFVIRGGYIVTDNHVVTLDGALRHAALRVFFSNGDSARAYLIGRDPYSDIAVIRARDGAAAAPALTMGNSTGVEVGDPVIAVGSPLGLADTVTSGIVSAVRRPIQPGQVGGTSQRVYFDAIQTDAAINPGSSGGPLVNAQGQVIGIDAAIDTLGANPMTGTQGGSIGLGFAIPINQARRVAMQLIKTGHATHAVLGAHIDSEWGGVGARIAAVGPGRSPTVTPGGPAARAGLAPGDVIVRFAGQQVTNGATLLDAIASLPPGAHVHMTFVRRGRQHGAALRLGSARS